MHKNSKLLVLISAAILGLANTDCRHVKQNRNVKIDICNECKELLYETIAPVLTDLQTFSECLENISTSAPVLADLKAEIKVTEAEVSLQLPVFIHQIKLIQHAWEEKNMPVCSQNLEKYLTKVLCLVRGSSRRKQSCVAKQRTRGPKSGRKQIIDYTGNYIRKVYGILYGFVSNL